MNALADAQTNFIDTINQGPAALNPHLFAGSEDRILLSLKAHANTISHARLVALESSFPLARAVLGEASFNALSRLYCKTATARASDTNAIGAGFADYLVGHTSVNIVDLVRIEWAWLESYHSADATPMVLADLATLDEQSLLALGIMPHPAARIVTLSSPDFDLISELKNMQDAVSVLITRPDAEIRLMTLNAVTTQIFVCAQKSVQLCNLLEIATEQKDEMDPLAPIMALIGAGALNIRG